MLYSQCITHYTEEMNKDRRETVAPAKESTLVSQIVAAIRKAYPDTSWVLKVHGGPMQEPGIPDILALVGGQMFGLEVKLRRAGESADHALSRTTDIQWNQLGKIIQAGGIGRVVLSVEEALSLIEAALDPSKEID